MKDNMTYIVLVAFTVLRLPSIGDDSIQGILTFLRPKVDERRCFQGYLRSFTIASMSLHNNIYIK